MPARALAPVLLLSLTLVPGCLQALDAGSLFARTGPEGPFTFYVVDTGEVTPVARRALASALAYWAAAGYDVQPVATAQEANRLVTFGGVWADHEVGSACVTERTDVTCEVAIALGSQCERGWVAFDEATVTRVVAHEVGHALGLEHSRDPEDVMYESVAPGYQDLCGFTDGAATIGPGQWWGLSFTLVEAREVGYLARAQGDDLLETCIIEEGRWETLASGPVDGWVCQRDVAAPRGSALLPAGDYRFVGRCADHRESCVMAYELGWA